MRLQVGQDIYFLDFIHEAWPNFRRMPNSELERVLGREVMSSDDVWVQIDNGMTYCEIKDLDGKLLFEGQSKAGLGDRFSKRTGRKISFGRAIAELGPGMRRIWWDAYFKVLPKDMRG